MYLVILNFAISCLQQLSETLLGSWDGTVAVGGIAYKLLCGHVLLLAK